MIELTGQDGQTIAINVGAIWHIRAASSRQTAVYAVSGAAVFVREAFDVVLELCRTALTTNGPSMGQQ